MAKKRLGHGTVNAKERLDKPDWAADLFREERPKKPGKAAKETEAENPDVTVKDHLSRGVVDKLAALKAQMKAQEVKPATSTAKAKTASTPSPRVEDDGERSFAELFNPVEPDDSSFEDLLKSSKLDWRSFKE